MMDSEFEEFEIKTEIEIEDLKPPDLSVAGMISRNNQQGPTSSQVNETENSKEFFDVSEHPIIKLEIEAKQEIKEEPIDDVFMEQNEDLMNVKTHSEEDNPLPISDEPKVQEMVGVQKRNYKCNVCDKAFYKELYLNRHTKYCQIFKCEICSEILYLKSALTQHKKKHESNERHKKLNQRRFNPSKCEYCLKVFQNTFKLHGHIWKVHQCATKHDCFFCKKSFQSFDDSKEHIKNCDDRCYSLVDESTMKKENKVPNNL